MLFIEPIESFFAVKLVSHAWIEIAQMRHVGDGVGELRIGKRPPRPIGKARGFIQAPLQHLLHQRVISNPSP